jgi:uncharacterized protein
MHHAAARVRRSKASARAHDCRGDTPHGYAAASGRRASFPGGADSGNFVVEPVHPSDWLRIAQLVEQYRELPLGTVDASIVAAAERLRISTIATLDRRHFSVVGPKHVEAFELLP